MSTYENLLQRFSLVNKDDKTNPMIMGVDIAASVMDSTALDVAPLSPSALQERIMAALMDFEQDIIDLFERDTEVLAITIGISLGLLIAI